MYESYLLFPRNLVSIWRRHVHYCPCSLKLHLFNQINLIKIVFNIKSFDKFNPSLLIFFFIFSWYCRECALNSDTEEKKSLNKVIIFVFFAHTKYSRSFIKLMLNHWCHMNYFNDVLTTFLGLERVSCFAVYAGSESSRISSKYLNLCSKDEQRS